jgi:hypothetical protein
MSRTMYAELRQYARDCGFKGNFQAACVEELPVDTMYAGPLDWLFAARRVAAQAEAHLEARAQVAAEEAEWEAMWVAKGPAI